MLFRHVLFQIPDFSNGTDVRFEKPKTFDTIFVQDADSVELLNAIGINQVVQAGDPRFDRVKAIFETEWKDEIIENFKQNDKFSSPGAW